MAINTNIEIAFFENDSVKPRVIIKTSDSVYEVRKKQWVQILILLIYHRLVGINDGWVALEDLNRLSIFRKHKKRAIGKYISQSIFLLHPYLQRFIYNYLSDLNTIGPYKLLINPAFVKADLSMLEIYLKQISLRITSSKDDNLDLWDGSKAAFANYELCSSRELASAYIKRIKSHDYYNLPRIAEIYIRLAEIERRCHVKRTNYYYVLGKAKQICKDILQPELKKLIMAYILSTHALLVEGKVKNKRVSNIIENSLDMIQSNKNYEADRFCLIAGRYYHLSSMALRERDYRISRDFFIKAITNYRRMEEAGPTKVVNLEKGIIEGSTLQRVIMSHVKNLEHFNNDELCWYQELINTGRVSPFLILSIGEWMLESILVGRDYDEAFEFVSGCLITHAGLHETGVYQRLVKKYRELKTKVQHLY
ncbi:hypothetical protein K9N50_12220 [bacterium]|nr:hypothetical protein [bacterium]